MLLGCDLPDISVDKGRIDQVISNLVGNAIKFSDSKTDIVVRCRVEKNEIIVEVCEQGPGFRDDEIEKVFVQPNNLRSRLTGGELSTGIGLAICANFVHLRDGQIGVRNNPGAGATFWFSLPLD